MRKQQERAIKFAEETAATKDLDDVQVNEALDGGDHAQEQQYEEEEEDLMTSVSQQQQMDPTKSQLSNMTGRTYISQLQKQLEDEKYARENLE